MDSPSRTAYASSFEVQRALLALTSSDHLRLTLCARAWATLRLGGSVGDAEDLLQDAFRKTLDGRRRWRRGVPLVRHLDRVMESDSGHRCRGRSRAPRRVSSGQPEPADATAGPPERLQLQEEVRALLARVRGDPQAVEFLEQLIAGHGPRVAAARMGLGPGQLRNLRRRLRRRLLARWSALEDGTHA